MVISHRSHSKQCYHKWLMPVLDSFKGAERVHALVPVELHGLHLQPGEALSALTAPGGQAIISPCQRSAALT